MACHLSHKLPWEKLLELYVDKGWERRTRSCPPKAAPWLQQFAWHFVKQLKEFRSTDSSSYEEISMIDPKRWGDYEFIMNGTCFGYYDSLYWGYIELNLLLLSPERVAPLMMPKGDLTHALTVLCGWSGGSHPDNLALHLRQVVDEDRHFKPFTPEVLKVLRDHAALMFRCMYSITGENKLLEDDRVHRLTHGFFGWRL